MVLASRINVPLTSISEIKKAPMTAFSLSKKTQEPVYVLNNNKEVGVVLDIDQYNSIVDFIEKAQAIIDNVAEDAYQEKIEQRINSDKDSNLSNEEVLGKNWRKNLEQIPDEWD
ncbi:hypothetical protein OZX56_02775 [Lactobacillus sp. ESL0684]|uniref:type II toxin-antitoxin system Phd/YefM family antitoxin n=1 Tax=unclassified Lactobacillus TaxID=2620435 RepID=UPI0023F81DB0|nr:MULTISPECIES: type II toxin-antitoxin system Phd/YefM family antitoxin [unclassified Lactobacillus]WEV41000.1 hypothetical protein OZX59_03530 [Lactobacillus sp. ESL0681]WEV44170.1 hypothetical protein OZX56_02775 [Lactobacillus sp. ESL0684]